jgi:hypothetical protein
MHVGPSFGMHTRNQEDTHWNQENNLGKYPLNDYYQQHKGMWSRKDELER